MSLLVSQFLDVPVLPQPPYSPDLAPADFWLFPQVKEQLKGQRFHSAEDVRIAATEALKNVSQNGFQDCFEKWYGRWQTCVAVEGAYFEGGCV